MQCYASTGTSYHPVSKSVSVINWCSIEKDERTDLVFGMEASFDQSYTVL